MSVQGVYTGTCACASTGIHVCAWAEGWQRQAEGWKGAELPSWVHGGSWGHATPWHGAGGGGHRDPSPGKAGLRASLIKHLLLTT